jgi:uncharacterized protein YdhG (YjbR/CyaY superfamily)
MAQDSGDRSSYFPAIEAKHGQAISHWLGLLETSGETTYPGQMALLRDGHGFSRTHANAVVMWFRGSTSSQRYRDPEQFFASLDPTPQRTLRKIFDAMCATRPEYELVMAWNHPMLRVHGQYVIGVSVAAHHLTINPFSTAALERAVDHLTHYVVNKHTFQVPWDWEVDAQLLELLVQVRASEILGT